MTAREKYNAWGVGLSMTFAIVSVLAAINPHSKLWTLLDHQNWGRLIVAVWTIAPPVFFWIDWVCFLPADAGEREVAKHTHDLARNIWLGLLAVVTYAFFKDLGLPTPP
jgi:hypothetical protein